MKKDEFSQLGLEKNILRGISNLGYEEMTKVQKEAIPVILEGNDLVVKSQTGSGKTAAFGIPMCNEVLGSKESPQALVVVPTRELAIQVRNDLGNISKFKKLRVVEIYGQAPYGKQIRELKKGAHIVVGTPGRLIDHIKRGNLKTKDIGFLVLDEADEMLKMGFLDQVETIISRLPKDRRSLLFSATMPNNIRKLSKDYMTEPKYIEIKSNSNTMDRIEQVKYGIRSNNKSNLLKDILVKENPTTCIVFCNTRRNVEKVTKDLKFSGYSVDQIHGGMEQKLRSRVMASFRKGQFNYLVATDVAARGIDIDDISHVINYDIPREVEAYVHRIGRTGRKDKTGKAISIYHNSDKKQLREILNYIKVPIEDGSPLSSSDMYFKDDNKKEKNQNTRNNKRKNKENMLKLHINAGKKANLTSGDIIDAICNIEGIQNNDVGSVSIIPTSTFVEILNGKGDYVKEELHKYKIKGRKRKVSVAKNQKSETSFVS